VHVNVWKSRLARAGLPVGPWLRDLKRAMTDNLPDHHHIRIGAPKPDPAARTVPLGALREVVTVTPGQKIAYVTDVADTPGNRRAIVDLARNADLLFIEAAFVQSDAHLAQARAHLTTTAAGQIARAAEVRRIEPFHFSPRYAGEDERLLEEVRTAFGGALRPT
jgi:ribonuclease Z